MFESITTLTELNQERARLYQTCSREEWPLINAAYTKAVQKLRQKSTVAKKLVIESLRPRVDIMTSADTVTDAIYSAEHNLLCLIRYTSNILQKTEPIMERVIELDIMSSPISIGVRL